MQQLRVDTDGSKEPNEVSMLSFRQQTSLKQFLATQYVNTHFKPANLVGNLAGDAPDSVTHAAMITQYTIPLSKKEQEKSRGDLELCQMAIKNYYKNHEYVKRFTQKEVPRLDGIVEFRIEVRFKPEVIEFVSFGESEDRMEFVE